MHKLFHRLDRPNQCLFAQQPSTQLGETRTGGISSSPIVPITSSSPVLSSIGRLALQGDSVLSCSHRYSAPNRVALQNEDDEEEAVVITALDTIPFCCHEDLLTMSRHHLVGVARILNAKLPKILQIDMNNTDSFIRNSIEVLVGIRKGALMSPPPTPTVDGSRRYSQMITTHGMDDDDSVDGEQQLQTLLNTSPLAKRAGRVSAYGSPCVTPRLSRLVEEDEDDDRPFKRRRISAVWNNRLENDLKMGTHRS